MPVMVYAAEVGAGETTESSEESWLDKAKSAGSDALDWVKEKTPAAKEKAGELWDRTKEKAGEVKEKAGEARDEFRDWNQDQQDEFWDRTRQQLNGDDAVHETTPAPTEAAEDSENSETGQSDNASEAPKSGSSTSESEDTEEQPSAEAQGEPEPNNLALVAPTQEPQDEAEVETTSHAWLLPLIIVAIFVAGAVVAYAYLRWEKHYDDRE